MARTEVRSSQIKDSTINLDDIDIVTIGKSLITKVIAGTNISISQTGADSGTGAVTISSSGGAIFSKASTQNLTAGTTITVTDGTPVTLLTSSGTVTLTSVPNIATGTRDGQYLVLFNANSTGNIILQDINQLAGSGVRLTAGTLTLVANRTVAEFIYDATMGGWFLLSTNLVQAFVGAITGFNKDGIVTETQEIGAASTEFSGTAPVFNATFTGIPSSVTVNIGGTASSEEVGSDYPITITSFPSLPIIANGSTTPASKKYYRGTSVGQTTTFQITTATVSGTSGLSSSAVTATWNNRRYWGPHTGTVLTSPQILTLDNTANGGSDLTNSSSNSPFVVTTGASEYMHYAHRTTGLANITYMGISTTTSGNYTGGTEIIGFTGDNVSAGGANALLSTVNHTNDYGAAEFYQPYRSISTNFGASKSFHASTSAIGRRRYAGPNTSSTTITTSDILALDNNTSTGASSLSTADGYGTFPVNITGANYLWFAHDNAHTAITYMSFGGLIMGFSNVGTVSHTNDFGFTKTYRIYKSTNQALGSGNLITSSTQLNNKVVLFKSTNTTAGTGGGTDITNSEINAASLSSNQNVIAYSPNIASVPVTSTGEYLWYVFPNRLTYTTISFFVSSLLAGGMDGNGTNGTTFSYTNNNGFTETYRAFRADNPALGTLSSWSVSTT